MHVPFSATESAANFPPAFDFGVLDFGILEPGENQVRQVQLEVDKKVTGTCKVTYSEPNAWFKIVGTQPLSSSSLFPLAVSIAVNTDNLPAGRRYDGWLLLSTTDVNARIALTIQIGKPPMGPRFALPKLQRRFAIGFFAITLVASLFFYLFQPAVAWLHGRQSSSDVYTFPSYSNSAVQLLQKLLPQPSAEASPLASARLAFSVYENNQLSLYLAQADGGQQEKLGIAGWSPVWSSDGKDLAFLSDQTGASQVYVMNLARREPVQLTNSLDDKSALAWSPDQTKIAFIAGKPDQGELKIVNVPANIQAWRRNQPVVTQAQTDRFSRLLDTTIMGPQAFNQPVIGVKSYLSWASDSKALLFSVSHQAQPAVYQAKDAQIQKFARDLDGWDPAWSPDNSRIAIGSNRGIFLLDDEGQNSQRIASFAAWSPLWSPNGQQLAFLSDQDNPPGKLDLWVMASDGSDLKRLTTTGCLYFTWSPDGEQMAYISGDPVAQAPILYLWLITPGDRAQVIAEVGEPYVAW